MTPPPRLLAIMGSGETAPTMVEVHKRLLGQLGPAPTAAILDTPFGFQTNADELVARTADYFRRQVGTEVAVASLRSGAAAPAEIDAAVATLRRADYVFSGPGSPTYALRQWHGTAVPHVLAEKVERGGCVTFASAAALTLGTVTVPVYEIYKAGEPLGWLPGLDVLAQLGLRAAVIPHYDNAEGGTHDTRYCYLGEERLAAMEADLPTDAFVLGVDEHTALVVDAGDRTAEVLGRGAVTVRCRGRSTRFAAGETVALDDLVAAARAPAAPRSGATPADAAPAGSAEPSGGGTQPARSPLLDTAATASRSVDTALAAGQTADAVHAILELEQALVDWATDPLQSDEPDRARSVLRDLIGRLGEAAANRERLRSDHLVPLVEALVAHRDRLRAEGDWAAADELRSLLGGAGVDVGDAPGGGTWKLRR